MHKSLKVVHNCYFLLHISKQMAVYAVAVMSVIYTRPMFYVRVTLYNNFATY